MARAFDEDKMEVFFEETVGDYKMQVYSYDGGEPKLRVIVKGAMRSYVILKGVPLAEVAGLAKAMATAARELTGTKRKPLRKTVVKVRKKKARK